MADRFERNLVAAAARERELRPKNHGVAAIVDFEALFRACAASETLECLYLQSQPHLGDRELELLGELLRANRNITGVNLGELPKPTETGWDQFIGQVSETALVDCYAQPVSGGPTDEGCLRLKRAIVANRRRLGVERGKHPSMWRTRDYPSLA